MKKMGVCIKSTPVCHWALNNEIYVYSVVKPSRKQKAVVTVKLRCSHVQEQCLLASRRFVALTLAIEGMTTGVQGS